MPSITEQEILHNFPYPDFRKYQEPLLKRMAQLWSSDIKVILLDAPTGLGKSGVNAANALCFPRSFYATPQITLINQILSDKYLGKFFTDIKGRSHYQCIKDSQYNSTVDVGMCTRVKDFIPQYCQKTLECPYWIQKMKCINSRIVLTDFAYLILEGMSGNLEPPFLGVRDFCVYDESHQIDQHLIHLISIKITPYQPSKHVYEQTWKMFDQINSVDNLRSFLQLAQRVADEEAKDYAPRQLSMMNWSTKLEYYVKDLLPENVKTRDKLMEFSKNVDAFLESTEKSGVEWLWNIEWVTRHDPVLGEQKVKMLNIQPLRARYFAPEYIWQKAGYFIVSSATLLDPDIFVDETGLDRAFNKDEIKHLEVPGVFPAENRPVVDMSIGNMRREDIDENLPRGVERIKEIARLEMGDNLEKPVNIAVHVHSYRIAKEVSKLLEADKAFQGKVISHTSINRTDQLESWLENRGNILIAVGFEEGQNWIGDLCSAMILFKVPYPDLSDRRVARRLQLKNWNWYYAQTVMKVVQTYGRQIRSETDKKRFYIVDSAFWGLLQRRPSAFPEWFKEAISPADKQRYKLKF